MTRLIFLVEGQTEERVANELISPTPKSPPRFAGRGLAG